MCGWYLSEDKWCLIWDHTEYMIDAGDTFAFLSSAGYWQFRVWNEAEDAR